MRAGHVFAWHDKTLACAASHGELPEPAQFEPWLPARLDRDLGELSRASDADRTVVAGRGYRMLPLVSSERFDSQVVGALVIPDERVVAIPHKVLLAMADRLHNTPT